MIDDDDDRYNRRGIEETPAETPFSKNSSMPQYERLYHYLASLEIRMAVIEKAQVYIINRLENSPEEFSIVAGERSHLQKSSKNLLDHWLDSCREDFESVRPSQSIVVNVEPPAAPVQKPTIFPSFSKIRGIIVVIGVVVAGVITGCMWFLDMLKSLKH
jgi:hypothetical protein